MNVERELAIQRTTLDSTPKWSRDQDNPPLSLKKALATAMEYIQKEHGKKNWVADSIKLKSFGGDGYWFYIVRFQEFPINSSKDGLFPVVDVVVLMSGEILAPR